MRNQMLPKAVRESLKSQPTMSDLPEEQRAKIQAHQDMMNEKIAGRSHRDAILALEVLMGEDGIDRNGIAFRNASKVVLDYYGKDSNMIITGVMDDGEKFALDGESRGDAYQQGGIIGGIQEYFNGGLS